MLKKLISIIASIFIIMGTFIYADTQPSLTREEKDYIAKSDVIKAISIDGAAPMQYRDSRGSVQGISKSLLEEISSMTGLSFEYKLYNSIEEIYADSLETDFDIFFGITHDYAPPEIILSQPFLKTETILYINSSLDSNQLDNKVYAAVRGSELPEGVKEENSIYFDTREESLDAVERGKADYGYGNAYSVSFYTLQNSYKNIVAIPKGKEIREYCIGILKDDRILLSIINKSIDVIDENKMQTLILDVTSRIDRKITFAMVMDRYGKQIFTAHFLGISILLLSVIVNVRANNRLKIQNKRNHMLSQISNEYLYEYFVKSGQLELSENYAQLFETKEQLREVTRILKDILLNNNLDGNIPIIKLPFTDGREGIFKSIALNIHNEKGKLDSIIGKLIDISEETAEKEKLIKKTKIDGLTGLYNATTTKDLIGKSIKNRDKYGKDALIVVDCDDFKNINDTYGHLIGDHVLENVGEVLKLTFRQSDIIGRIGGDEFCVYMKNVSSDDLVQSKCQQLNALIQETNKDICISVSVGIAILNEEDTYEKLFAKADKALYRAKGKGGAQPIIYKEEQ